MDVPASQKMMVNFFNHLCFMHHVISVDDDAESWR